MWSQKDEKYDHIDKSDVDKVQKCYDEKLKWYETNMNVSNSAKKYDSPVVLVSQILQQKQVSSSLFCWHGLSKYQLLECGPDHVM